MAEISWIKLKIEMFDDEKIKLIENMPDGDTMVLIWIKLLCMAGKINDGGLIYINKGINYNDEMLSIVINKPLSTIKLAISTFQQFGMIDIFEDGEINILNWNKHQSIDKLEKIKEDNRKRSAKYREKKKLENNHVTVTLHHAIEEEKEKEEEEDIEKEKEKEEDIDKELKEKYKKENFNFRKSLIDLGIEEEIVDDWLKVRKAKKGVNTKIAFNKIKEQIEKSHLSPNECIKIAVERSWSGFNHEWVKNNNTINHPSNLQGEREYEQF